MKVLFIHQRIQIIPISALLATCLICSCGSDKRDGHCPDPDSHLSDQDLKCRFIEKVGEFGKLSNRPTTIEDDGLRERIDNEINHIMERAGSDRFESWLLEMANHNNAYAQFWLGFDNEKKSYSGPNELYIERQKSALHWYNKSAQNHYGPAYGALGNAYANGVGIAEPDMTKAITWLEKGAEWGDVDCELQLAEMYSQTDSAVKDLEKAAFWYEKAVSKRANLKALMYLGNAYMNGSGVAEDPRSAYKWFLFAKHEGSDIAAQKALDLSKSLNEEQIQWAKNQLDTWKASFKDTGR